MLAAPEKDRRRDGQGRGCRTARDEILGGGQRPRASRAGHGYRQPDRKPEQVARVVKAPPAPACGHVMGEKRLLKWWPSRSRTARADVSAFPSRKIVVGRITAEEWPLSAPPLSTKRKSYPFCANICSRRPAGRYRASGLRPSRVLPLKASRCSSEEPALYKSQ